MLAECTKMLVVAAPGLAVFALPAAAQPLEPEWVRFHDGPVRQSDAAFGVAPTPDGGAVVTGRSRGIGSEFDFATVRYDADGDVVWTDRYNGPEGEIDEASFVGVDAAGNAYVTGSSWDGLRPAGGEWDYVTIKYTPDGSRAWVRRYNGPGNWSDSPTGLAVDAAGNAYISGFVFVEPDRFNRYATHFHVLKYDTEGNIDWEHQIDLPPRLGAGARDIALDAKGNVYATGVANGGDGFNNDDDILTVKIDPSGILVYAVAFDSEGFNSGLDDGHVITADDQGNAYVGGQTYADGETNRTWDTTTLKYDPQGTLLWSSVLEIERPDGPRDIEVDEAGNVYIAGGWDNPLDTDGFTLSYGPDGAQRWIHFHDEPEDYDQQINEGVEIGADGLIYSAVETQRDSGYDYLLIRFEPDGTIVSQDCFDAGSTSDVLWDFELDARGNAFLVGQSFFPLTITDYTTMKVVVFAPPCPADWNGDGVINSNDFFVFLDDFFADNADFNGDGATTSDDFFAYLTDFFEGCP